MIKKGDRIDIKPEWQDAGDENYVWVAVDDEEKGFVTITPISMPVGLRTRSVVGVEMITIREVGFVINLLKEQGLAPNS
jgi:hypothetical protein